MSPVPDPSQNHKVSPLDDLNYENHGTGLIGPGSSSEEEDHPANEIGEYQPLPQEPENLDDDDEAIDYSSLSGILSAFNMHGPNEISTENSQPPQMNEETSEPHKLEGIDSFSSQVSELRCGSTSSTLQSHECERQRGRDYRKEQASLWNSEANQIEIDEDKKEVIKLAMAKITLPNSAIPTWAKELSEEEWKTQIYSRLFGKDAKDEQR